MGGLDCDRGAEPRWGPDGDELFYRGPEGVMVALRLTTQRGIFLRGTPELLFSDPYFSQRHGLLNYDYRRTASGF